MSLINEALKRTRDASYQGNSVRPMTLDTYRVSNRPDAALGSRTSLWVSVLVIALAGVVVLVLALRVVTRPGRQLHEALSVAEMPTPLVDRAPARKEPATPAAPIVVATVPAAPATVVPMPVTSASIPAPEAPKLVLQGVTSTASWREAMINNYTVREGDDVDGARVVTIESRRVVLQFGDREIVLRMP